MLSQPDKEQREALRRLRNHPDFKVFEGLLEHHRQDVAKRCTLLLDEPRLRMHQGAAQALAELLEHLEGER